MAEGEKKKKKTTSTGFPVSHGRRKSSTAGANSQYLSLSLAFLQVNVDDTAEMLPKSRRALTIQEIAALARSSLHGEFKGRNLDSKSEEEEKEPLKYFFL